MSSEDVDLSRKRPREDEDRSATIYLQCKHISKPWDLLNGFLFENSGTIGLAEFYEEKEVGGAKHMELKHDAPVEIAYAFWSRKPYYLVEFRGERRAALAANLLSLGNKKTFKDAPVVVSLAKGTSVAEEKQKMAALGGVPKHGGDAPAPKGTAPSTAEATKPTVPAKAPAPSAPAKPTATTFVPRALWKRP